MTDRSTALDRISVGEPDLSFPPGTPVEDVIRAIAARAEVRGAVVSRGLAPSRRAI
jgi:hypothetical protein